VANLLTSLSVRRATTCLALLSAAVAACTGGSPGRGRVGPAGSGGDLVVTIRSEPRTFNRLVARDSTSIVLSTLTHAKLVRINPETDEVEPWLAERWTRSPDGLSYTITLRDGIAFSDGTPLTAADVLFSLEAAYDPQVASPLGDALRIRGEPLQAQAPDRRTVVVTFPRPYAPGLRLLDNLPVLPRHRLEPAWRAGRLAETWGVTTPGSEMPGLGPFVLERYVPGQRLVFVRNPRYWRRDRAGRPLPYLDRVIVEIVPDQQTEVLRLESGAVDLISSEIRAEDYAPLRRAAERGAIRLFDLGVGIDADFLWFNLTPAAVRRAPPWLARAEFRQALAHAVDRTALANTVYLGLAVPVYGPVTPGNPRWYWAEAPAYPFDPARARRLLAGLGLADSDGDGVLDDGRGRTVRLTVLTQKGHTVRERTMALVREDLRRVGVAVDVVPLEFGTLVGLITRGEYEAAYLGVRASDTDPASHLDFWMSSGALHFWNPGQRQPATAWERRIDQLMLQHVAADRLEERQRLFRDVQRIFAEQVPALYFVAPRVIIATAARVGNVRPVSVVPQVLWNVDELTVAPRPGR
jgi:peptide/nickel transport system substrate-binding protein